eukprot:jgi/Bigna1/87316/estExt_fgenesh1_pg.C_190041
MDQPSAGGSLLSDLSDDDDDPSQFKVVTAGSDSTKEQQTKPSGEQKTKPDGAKQEHQAKSDQEGKKEGLSKASSTSEPKEEEGVGGAKDEENTSTETPNKSKSSPTTSLKEKNNENKEVPPKKDAVEKKSAQPQPQPAQVESTQAEAPSKKETAEEKSPNKTPEVKTDSTVASQSEEKAKEDKKAKEDEKVKKEDEKTKEDKKAKGDAKEKSESTVSPNKDEGRLKAKETAEKPKPISPQKKPLEKVKPTPKVSGLNLASATALNLNNNVAPLQGIETARRAYTNRDAPRTARAATARKYGEKSARSRRRSSQADREAIYKRLTRKAPRNKRLEAQMYSECKFQPQINKHSQEILSESCRPKFHKRVEEVIEQYHSAKERLKKKKKKYPFSPRLNLKGYESKLKGRGSFLERVKADATSRKEKLKKTLKKYTKEETFHPNMTEEFQMEANSKLKKKYTPKGVFLDRVKDDLKSRKEKLNAAILNSKSKDSTLTFTPQINTRSKKIVGASQSFNSFQARLEADQEKREQRRKDINKILRKRPKKNKDELRRIYKILKGRD